MKALALVESPEHVCCRYRIRAFEPALSRAGWDLDVVGLARGTLARFRQWRRASDYSVVILQRKLLDAWQLSRLRKWSRRLVFDFDDAILYRDSYDPRGPFDPRRASRFARTVKLADAVIAGNDFLAESALAAGALRSRVRVIPTCVETDRYQPRKPSASTDRPGLNLVWIGSSSTLQGLEQQRALWERLGREVPGLRLRVICDRFPRFDPLPVESIAWNEETEAAELAKSDVGIAWMPEDRWSRGKCGLKVLQYQAAGLPVVANPVGVHASMIEPGINGFLPDTAEEWVTALRALADDASLCDQLGRAARESVESRYSVATWSDAFVSVVRGSSEPAEQLGGARPHQALWKPSRETLSSISESKPARSL